MVVIAMMSAITVVANIICAYTIPLHAGTAVVIITGIALGPEAGVLTGALARFVCNFFMGQGIWTPWEMVAWAMLGGLAGVFFYKPVYTGYLEDKKKIRRESTKYGVMQLAAPAAIIILCELAGYIEYIIAAPSGETYMGWRVYVFGIVGIIIAAVNYKEKGGCQFSNYNCLHICKCIHTVWRTYEPCSDVYEQFVSEWRYKYIA